MQVVYLIGGIASGKSQAAARLRELGAVRIDLDQLSREVLAPGSALLDDIAREFGEDLLVEGELDRSLLAQRAFDTPEATAQLEELELPAIKRLLVERLDALRGQPDPPGIVVVEVPLPDRMGPLLDLADEVVCVSCPVDIRRERAVSRGMAPDDFDRRVAHQLTDAEMQALANTILDNCSDEASLQAQVDAWWQQTSVSTPPAFS